VLLNVTERTVRRMIEQSKLHVIRDGSGFVRIDQDDIDAWNTRKPHQAHPSSRVWMIYRSRLPP